MIGPLEDVTWLFRGVPLESPEVSCVINIGEIRPPRPDRIGEQWRRLHMMGDTETGYTSWSIERSMAQLFAEESSDDLNLSGQVVIFRVRVDSLSLDQVFQGREDEDEYLIQGTVEEVSLSEGYEDDEESERD